MGGSVMSVVPIQGLTWMKQALVRSPRRAKELYPDLRHESWGSGRVTRVAGTPLPHPARGHSS